MLPRKKKTQVKGRRGADLRSRVFFCLYKAGQIKAEPGKKL
jgi:hypothetical protein